MYICMCMYLLYILRCYIFNMQLYIYIFNILHNLTYVTLTFWQKVLRILNSKVFLKSGIRTTECPYGEKRENLLYFYLYFCLIRYTKIHSKWLINNIVFTDILYKAFRRNHRRKCSWQNKQRFLRKQKSHKP